MWLLNPLPMKTIPVQIKATSQTICISRMGQSCQWFHRELLDAYNKRVLLSFHITDEPDFETEGQYFFEGVHGKAIIRVFSDCFCILPPNLNARRIPFVFIDGIKKDAYSLTITLNTEEVYSFSLLGFDLDPLENIINIHLRNRKNSDIAFVRKLTPALGFANGTQAGVLLSEGIAVQLSLLPAVLAETLEKKAMNSKMGATYKQLKDICDSKRLAVGIKSLPEEEFAALQQAIVEKSQENENENEINELTPEQQDALRWVIWMAIPSMDGKAVVVEFAFPGEDAATYLFRKESEWERFLIQLNRGMEATQMSRETFSLPEDALQAEESAGQLMNIMRTPALQELRKQFIARVIHRSSESWKASLMVKLEKGSVEEPKEVLNPLYCRFCGKRNSYPKRSFV